MLPYFLTHHWFIYRGHMGYRRVHFVWFFDTSTLQIPCTCSKWTQRDGFDFSRNLCVHPKIESHIWASMSASKLFLGGVSLLVCLCLRWKVPWMPFDLWALIEACIMGWQLLWLISAVLMCSALWLVRGTVCLRGGLARLFKTGSACGWAW